MLEGPRGKSSRPAWDAQLKSVLYGNVCLLAACKRAGFTLLREAARPTVAQLVECHQFTEDEARALHRFFAEDDRKEAVLCGDEFASLVFMYINDAKGGEGNPQRAKKALQEMLGKPYTNQASINALEREMSESRYAEREANWRNMLQRTE